MRVISRFERIYFRASRAIGQKLGIDANYFIRGVVYGLIQQAIGLVSGLVIAYSFGHFASRTLFGEYNLAVSILSTLAVVSLPGLNVALLRSVGEGYDGSLQRAVKVKFKWSVLGIPLLAGIAIYYHSRGQSSLAGALLAVAILFPLLQSFQASQSFFVAKKRFDLQAWFSGSSSILTAILVAGTILLTHNLSLILGGYFLGQILPAIASFWKANKMAKRSKQDTDLVTYGYFLTGSQVLPMIVSHLGEILLASMLGVETLAVFIVATKFSSIVQKNFDVFYKPVTAKLAGQTKMQHRLTLKKHLGKFMVMSLVMFAGLWLSLPMLISWFYGPTYTEAVGYGRWYAATILPLPMIWLFADIMTFQKRKRAILILDSVIPVLKLAAYLVVIPRWQIGGLIGIMLAERFLTGLYSGIVVITKHGD